MGALGICNSHDIFDDPIPVRAAPNIILFELPHLTNAPRDQKKGKTLSLKRGGLQFPTPSVQVPNGLGFRVRTAVIESVIEADVLGKYMEMVRFFIELEKWNPVAFPRSSPIAWYSPFFFSAPNP